MDENQGFEVFNWSCCVNMRKPSESSDLCSSRFIEDKRAQDSDFGTNKFAVTNFYNLLVQQNNSPFILSVSRL